MPSQRSDRAVRSLSSLFRTAFFTLIAASLSLEVAHAARIRTGVHPGYERLVIESPQASTLPVEEGEGRVAIGPMLELGPQALARIRRLRAIASATAEKGRLFLYLVPDRDARVLRLPPNRLVVDFQAFQHDPQPAGSTAQDSAAADKAESTGSEAWLSAGASAEPMPAVQSATGVDNQPIAAPSTRTARSAQGQLRPPPNSKKPSSAATGRAEPNRESPPATRAAGAEADSGPQVEAPTAHEPRGHLKIYGLADSAAPPAIVFDWPKAVGAAAYRRSDRIWIVFDAPPVGFLIDRPSLEQMAAQGLRRIQTYKRDDAALIELVIDGAQQLSMQPDGHRWLAFLHAQPPETLEEALQLATEGPAALQLRSVQHLLRVGDPVVGDVVEVATALRALPGAPEGRRYVDLRVLPSFQGLAWVATADDLQASLKANLLQISRPNGLRIAQLPARLDQTAHPSDHNPEIIAASNPRVEPEQELLSVQPVPVAEDSRQPQPTHPSDPAFAIRPPHAAAEAASPPLRLSRPIDSETPDGPQGSAASAREREADTAVEHRSGAAAAVGLPPWTSRSGLAELRSLTAVERRELRERLRSALAEAPADQKTELVLQLARLQLAEGFAQETLIALRLLSPDRSVSFALAQRRALLAAAALALAGDQQPAWQLLSASDFADDAEADAWLGWLAAQSGNWDDAAVRLARRTAVFEAYPDPIRVQFMLAALAAALETGNPDRAYAWLDQLRHAKFEPPLAERARFLEAMAAARDGAYLEAQAILRALSQSASWLLAAESVFAETDLTRAFGLAGPEQELFNLLQNRHLWRGHPLEARVLRRIGQLQAEAGDVRAALASWREALARHPSHPAVADLPDEMRKLFVSALDPSLPPNPSVLTMLRIYREYPELRPPSPVGTTLARDLARALASHGLAASALALLRSAESNIEEAPLALAAELALAADQPEEALRLLGDRDLDDGQMAVLRALALMRLGRPEEALMALANIAGPTADRLRADAAWQANRLDVLAGLSERLLSQLEGAEDPIDRMRMARALSALAAHEPPRARALLDRMLAHEHDAPLRAAVALWLPPPPLSGEPRAVAATVRQWTAEVRNWLPLLTSPLQTAHLERPQTVP